ncbi:hypothetical protein ACQ676_000237 [Vibrio fluvialis]|nr:hypothetical protein [Vibrio fluvialis]
MKNGFFLTLVTSSLLAGCADKSFIEVVEEQGFTPFNPPIAESKVGSIFKFEKNSSNIITVKRLCNYLYDDLNVTTSDASLPEIKKNDVFDASISAYLIKDIVVSPPKLDAELKNVKSVEIKFSNPKIKYITAQDLQSNDGKPMPLSPSCFNVLESYAENDQLSEVFIIAEIMEVGSMEYIVDKKVNSDLNSEFNIKNVVDLKPNVNFTVENNYSMKINEVRSIAYKAFSVKSFKPNGLVGPASGVIEVEPLDSNQLKLLGN